MYAQEEVRSGKIVYVPEFAVWGTVGDGQACAVFGLKTDSVTYVLTADSVFLFGKGDFEIVGQICLIGDSAEISGYIHSVSDDHKAFSAFEIVNINKLTSPYQERVSGTYTGRLIDMPNPANTNPCLPGGVIGIECIGKQYVLVDKGWFWRDVEIGGVHYEVGDSVEIEGVLSACIDFLNCTYFELEIETIQKIETGGDATGNRTLWRVGNIYYDIANQNLVLDDGIRIDRLEVFDVWGRCVMRAERPAGSLSFSRLPNGLYIYNIITGSTVTSSGKFVK